MASCMGPARRGRVALLGQTEWPRVVCYALGGRLLTHCDRHYWVCLQPPWEVSRQAPDRTDGPAAGLGRLRCAGCIQRWLPWRPCQAGLPRESSAGHCLARSLASVSPPLSWGPRRQAPAPTLPCRAQLFSTLLPAQASSQLGARMCV